MHLNEEAKLVYNKLGYKNIFDSKTEEEIDLIKNYLLPFKLDVEKKEYQICSCGYITQNTKNKKCFICDKYFEEMIIKNSQNNLRPFSENERYKIEDIKVDKRKSKLISYLEGVIEYEFDETDNTLKSLNLDKLEEVHLKVFLNKNNELILMKNNKKISLMDFIIENQKELRSSLNLLIDIILDLNIKDEKLIKLIKETKKSINIFNQKITKQEELINNSAYSAHLNKRLYMLRKSLSSKKNHLLSSILYFYLEKDFFNSCDEKVMNIFKSFLFVKRKGFFKESEEEETFYYIKKFVEFITIYKENKIFDLYTIENLFNIDENLYPYLNMLNLNSTYLKSIKKLTKKEKNNLLYLLNNKDKLDYLNLNEGIFYQFILIYKKYLLDIDELIRYIEHIATHEGLTPDEVIYYYSSYVKKTKISELNKLPYPINIKLIVKKGVQ